MKTFFINTAIVIFITIGTIGCGVNDQNNQQNTKAYSTFENRTVEIYPKIGTNECNDLFLELGLCEVKKSDKPISVYLDFSRIKSKYSVDMINYLEKKNSDSNLSLIKTTYYNDDTNQTEINYHLKYGKDIYSYVLNKEDNNDSNLSFNMIIYSIHLNELKIDNIDTNENTFFSTFNEIYASSLDWNHHDNTVSLKKLYLDLDYLSNGDYKIITDKDSFDIKLIDGEIKATNRKSIEYFAFNNVTLDINTYYSNSLYTSYYSSDKTYFYHSLNVDPLIKNGVNIYDYKVNLKHQDKVIISKGNYLFITDDENKFKKYLKDNNLTNYYLNQYLEENNISQEDYFNEV